MRVCGTSENPLDSTEPAFDGIYEVNAPRLHHPLHGLHCEGHLNLLGDPERPLTGSLEVLECGWTIALDAPAQTGRRGRRKRYSDVAIEAGLMLRPAFGRPWRQTESMLGSIMGLLGLDLPVPEPVRASASVLHGCAGWRKRRPVSMLRISPSCRTNTMLTVAATFRGRSDA